MIRATLAALALLTTPALADETWRTDAGQIVYEADMGHIAVLSLPAGVLYDTVPGTRVSVYLPGLGGNFDNRSVHEGYWAIPGGPVCTSLLTTPDGMTTQRWGRVQILFDRAAFPTGFILLMGECFDDPTTPIRADLP